jgi:hypothetical protein
MNTRNDLIRNDMFSPRRLRALMALGWLFAGAVLLAFTPLRAHSEQWGWTPVFWLVLAPASLLVALQPRLPLRLVAVFLRHR